MANREVSSQTSFFEEPTYYTTQDGEGQPILSKVDLVAHLRTHGNYEFSIPRLIQYYFSSDAEGLVPIDSPGQAGAGVIITVLAQDSGRWLVTLTNVFSDPYVGYICVIVDDGVFSVALNMPGSVVP